MRQLCIGLIVGLLGALACSKAPTATSGQLTLQARNQTVETFIVSLTNRKTLATTELGQVAPTASGCYILPPYADSSQITVSNGAGMTGTTAPFIPTLSGSWQLSITPLTSTTVSALVSAGVSCTPP